MAWLMLIVSGILEAAWALCLKASQGFTRPGPTAGFAILLALSMLGLSLALRTLPVGLAYAVWVGVGATLTAILAAILFGEAWTPLRVAGVALIVGGVLLLNLSSARPA